MQIKGFVNFTVRIARSQIHGNGLYAVENMPAKRKIGSLGGEIISKRMGRVKAKAKKTISLVELWNGETLDASVNSNELKYLVKEDISIEQPGYLVNCIAPAERIIS